MPNLHAIYLVQALIIRESPCRRCSSCDYTGIFVIKSLLLLIN